MAVLRLGVLVSGEGATVRPMRYQNADAILLAHQRQKAVQHRALAAGFTCGRDASSLGQVTVTVAALNELLDAHEWRQRVERAMRPESENDEG